MAIDSADLVKRLHPLLRTLEADLVSRSREPAVEAGLRVSWEVERAASRTAEAFNQWRRQRCTQVAIAWILSVVFVRTLEDRGFLASRRFHGEGASDSERQFKQLAPFLTTRDYLLMVFLELARLPGAEAVFDARHDPVWVLAPSAEMATDLLDFFRKPDAKGNEPPVFDGTDTRFLGDLYQNLSEDVRKRYALLQTPEFIEEFILEQTLAPALEAFGLEDFRIIDPTCGSGHFLLGAFHHLFDAWQAEAPNEERQVLALRALAQVHGCDLNPYAVAIARFRLTLEFLEVAGIKRLEKAPRPPLNLCVGDSLLHGVSSQQEHLSSSAPDDERAAWGNQLFALEDVGATLRILGKRYHAVVGNPPYVTEKDARKREAYRELYKSASGKYALAAPFTERFFDLTVPEGFVGMINANSFTKRDFGKALIEDVLPTVDVQMIIDTSGAYIPGHGTPTLLLFGRRRAPGAGMVTAVLGKRGETEEPETPSAAPVWSEIATHFDDLGFDGRYISVEGVAREELCDHPWVLAGGGARGLKRMLHERAPATLADLAESVGILSVTGEDDVYLMDLKNVRRVQPGSCRPMVLGEHIRDWRVTSNLVSLWMYDSDFKVLPEASVPSAIRYLFPYRAHLSKRKRFGTPMLERGLTWYELQELYFDKLASPLAIAFAFVATHNHFVLERCDRLLKQSAPLLKLRDEMSERSCYALLGYLNSSTVGSWCRLVMYPKGGDQMGDGARLSRTPWEDRLEFAGNLLKQLPVPDLEKGEKVLVSLVENVEGTVAAIEALEPEKSVAMFLERAAADATGLREHRQRTVTELRRLQGILVSIQEEIDWRVYGLFGLPTLTTDTVADVVVPVAPEHRPFEVRLAREMKTDISARIWFERHRRTPPEDVGGPLADLYRRRLQLMEESKELQLLETPETKRRWPPRDYDAEFRQAYRAWFLDRIEDALAEPDRPEVRSARQLASILARDGRVHAVAELYSGESGPDLEKLVSKLAKDEGVAYVAALRFTDTGLEKRIEWKKTWDLQRRKDRGADVGDVPVPPDYLQADYRQGSAWGHRGALDVPKERFVLYPAAATEGDDTPVVGWAGWNHLQKAQALSGLYQSRKTEEGWGAERLTPLLAGLHELVPWLLQWHDEPSSEFGGQRLGQVFRNFVASEAHGLGLSLADLEAWAPTDASRAGRSRARGGARRAPALTAEQLLEAMAGSGGKNVAQAELAERLGVSAPTLSKIAAACVAEGRLVQASGRPKCYRLPGEA